MTTVNIYRDRACDSTGGIGTSIYASIDLTISHIYIDYLAFLIVTSTKYRTIYSSAFNVYVALVSCARRHRSIVAAAIYISLYITFVGYDNRRIVDFTHGGSAGCTTITTSCSKDVAACCITTSHGGVGAFAVAFCSTAEIDIGVTRKFSSCRLSAVGTSCHPAFYFASGDYYVAIAISCGILCCAI